MISWKIESVEGLALAQEIIDLIAENSKKLRASDLRTYLESGAMLDLQTKCDVIMMKLAALVGAPKDKCYRIVTDFMHHSVIFLVQEDDIFAAQMAVMEKRFNSARKVQ